MRPNQRSNLFQTIYQTMKLKETEELLDIWLGNDRLEWSDEAFEAIRVILLERLGKVPLQATSRSTQRQRKAANEKGRFPLSIILAVAVFLTVIVLLDPLSRPKPSTVAQVTSTTVPIIEISSFPSIFQIDNIDIEFSGHKVEKDNFIITICFHPPTQEVWSFGDTKFIMQHLILKESWTSAKGGIGIAGRSNCGELAYPINLIRSSGKAELSIGQLVTSFYGNCDRAQKNLDKAKTNISIRCDPTINNGLGFVIVKKPMFMKYEEAIFKAYSAFSDTIQVNWRFSFFVNKP